MNGRQPSAWYASTSSSAPAPAHASASAASPGTILESSKSTAETSTALAPGEPRRRGARRACPPGRAGSRTTSSPSSPSRPSWRRSVWNSPSVVTSFGRSRSGERGQEPQHELVRVRGRARPAAPGSSSSRADAVAQALRLRRTPAPTCRRVLGRVVPRLELPARAPTSGHAWCECPVSSSRSETRNSE